jgi:hypothetical protein
VKKNCNNLIELSAEIFDFCSTSDNESLFLAEKQMTQSLVFQVQNWYEHVGGDGFHYFAECENGRTSEEAVNRKLFSFTFLLFLFINE